MVMCKIHVSRVGHAISAVLNVERSERCSFAQRQTWRVATVSTLARFLLPKLDK